MQAGILPSHLIFFLRHISQAYFKPSISCHPITNSSLRVCRNSRSALSAPETESKVVCSPLQSSSSSHREGRRRKDAHRGTSEQRDRAGDAASGGGRRDRTCQRSGAVGASEAGACQASGSPCAPWWAVLMMERVRVGSTRVIVVGRERG